MANFVQNSDSVFNSLMSHILKQKYIDEVVEQKAVIG
jgi:hypothetical protein